ncbi:unnamed protein product [Ceratitis capitata]|uniref:(Mediterranean fruit fly) hypothetical protein n=1 Tax=Ceratitis capitata TaxID=7213 RepID=A0A811VGW6_CERCA|nr:unnamed protein product [Ceratitis capitata]
MSEDSDEEYESFNETNVQKSEKEELPNFGFPNLKDDPDLLQEFNCIDSSSLNVNEYLDAAITSNLRTIELKWKSECLICSEQFEEYQNLLEHCMLLHKDEFDEYSCTLQDCGVVFADEDLLARHLVLAHSDLENVKIYGSCSFCGLRYSNFHQLNKHSCYHKLKRTPGIQPYCEYCKEEFVSHKRLLFHLQFHLAKRRPMACLICNQEFCDVDEFFLHVNYAHEKPDKHACTICDRVFIDMENYNLHVNMHKNKPKFKCDECSKMYHVARMLKKHKEDCHTKIEYKCDSCPQIFPTFSMLQNHLKWHKADVEKQVYTCLNCGLIGGDYESLVKHTNQSCSECFDCEIVEETLMVSYRCQYCSQDFKDKDSLRKHRATGVHDNKKFSCPICQAEFDNPKGKRFHMAKHKNYQAILEGLPIKRLMMCDVGDCEESYGEWYSLQRHKHRLHQPNSCPKCNKKLSNVAEFECHIAQCQSNEFTCQFCNKKCPTKMSLSVHIARSHNNKNILCPHCMRAYKDEQALQQHIDYTHVPVSCTHCEKVISCRRYLEVHMRAVHESVCRYFCTHCNKGFYHRSQMELHEESVHVDAIYRCGECNFNTRYAKSLEIHIAKHLKKLEFKCPHCDKMFGRKGALNMHIKRHMNDKRFRCADVIIDGCDASFVARHLLNTHIINKHSSQGKSRKTASKGRQSKDVGTQRIPKQSNRSVQHAVVDMNTDAALLQTATAMETENNFTLGETLPSAADDNCMLLVVDDGSLQMVSAVDNAQLFVYREEM